MRLWILFFAVTSLWAAKPSDPLYFSTAVYPILQKANCRGCHTDEGVASATRVHFPGEAARPEEIEAFGRGLIAVVDPREPANSPLVKKPTNRVAHGGGERIPRGSPEEEVLLAWTRHLVELPSAGTQIAETERSGSAGARIRRLTHSQYNNTVRDLLGDQTQPARQFPAEDFVDGFKNQAHAQTISPLLTDAYFAAAEKLARNAFRFGDQRSLIPCSPTSATDADCAARFVRRFGLRAFRRPLAREEEAEFVALLITEADRVGQFTAGAQIVVEAMLESPNFLFRIERGEADGPDQFEKASQLSYALWDTMPDDELFRAAEAGELDAPADIEKQARRLLRSPLAREALNEFLSQWMRFDRLASAVKDRRLYSEFVPALADAMPEETRRLAHHLVWNNLNFMEFFSADYSFVNSALANLYQLPAPAEPFAKVKYPADSERAGVLGHALFLAQTGKPEETSPTERGLFVREHFLCQGVPPPPPGLNTTLPPFLIDSQPKTNRERMTELHLNNASCAGCHKLIDPIGFGLERLDTIGRWSEKQQLTIFPTKDRRKDVKPQKHELELDTSASIVGIPNSDFSSAKDLGRILSQDPTCQKCVVRNWFRFVMGRRETEDDRPELDRVFEDFRRSGFQFQEMMISLVGRPAGKAVLGSRRQRGAEGHQRSAK